MANLQIKVTRTLPSPPKVGGRGGYGYTQGMAKHGTLPAFLYQRHPEVGDQVTGHDWLIQHSNRVFKLSGLSSQIEMLD